MIDRLAERYAPFIIISGLVIGTCWLCCAALNAYGSAAAYSARINNK
jgi:hypothetical protein